MEEKTSMYFFSAAVCAVFFAMYFVHGVASEANEYAETVDGIAYDNSNDISELQREVKRLKKEIQELSYDSHSH